MTSSSSAKTFRSPSIRIALDENFKATEAPIIKDLQILKTGKFYDERYGKFEITKKMFSDMIQNFKANVRGVLPALDYVHDTEGKAAGWLKDLFTVDADGQTQLWGKWELTPSGQKSLADKEYAYLSADFDDNYKDNEEQKKHGCVLLGAALTNRPVIKNMASAIQLSEGDQMSDAEKNLKEEHEKMCAQYKELADGLGAKDHADAMAKVAAMKKPAEGSAEEEGKESPAEAASEEQKKMSEKLKLSEDRVTALEKKISAQEKEAKFTKLLSEGKAVEAQRKSFMENDMEEYAKNSKVIKLSEQGHGGEGEQAPVGGPEDEVREKAKKLSEEKKISMRVAIAEVLNSNPKLADSYNKKMEA